MSNQFLCYGCGVGLPIDAPDTIPTVKCSYCGNPNKNPNFIIEKHQEVTNEAIEAVQNDQQAKSEPVAQPIHVAQSPLASLLSGTVLLFVFVATFLFFVTPPSTPTYLLVAVIALLPVTAEYFVQKRWEKITKYLSSSTGEPFKVEYSLQTGWHYVMSYAYMVIFSTLYGIELVYAQYPELTTDSKFLVCIISFFLAFGFVWFVDKITEIIGSALGSIFEKNP